MSENFEGFESIDEEPVVNKELIMALLNAVQVHQSAIYVLQLKVAELECKVKELEGDKQNED